MNKVQKKKHTDSHYEKDELRARFTAWLDTTVYHAKLKYLRKLNQRVHVLSIDDVPESMLGLNDPGYDSVLMNEREFEFEEEKLSKAYSELSLMRKEILRLLFVEEMSAAEIAERMNCSVQHVYNQRSLAVKKLREYLDEGEGRNE